MRKRTGSSVCTNLLIFQRNVTSSTFTPYTFFKIFCILKKRRNIKNEVIYVETELQTMLITCSKRTEILHIHYPPRQIMCNLMSLYCPCNKNVTIILRVMTTESSLL